MFDRFIRSNPLVFGMLRGALLAAAVCDLGKILSGDKTELGKLIMALIAGGMTSTPAPQMKAGG
jgi:hypothetical protein